MIKRTAQEWADFTGLEFCVDEGDIYTLDGEAALQSKDIFNFSELKLNQIIKPSEPHVLVTCRILNEAAESLIRLNTALDGKIKEVDGQ